MERLVKVTVRGTPTEILVTSPTGRTLAVRHVMLPPALRWLVRTKWAPVRVGLTRREMERLAEIGQPVDPLGR